MNHYKRGWNMKKRILVACLLFTIIFSVPVFAKIINKNSKQYKNAQNSQLVTRAEFEKWAKEIHHILTFELDRELIYKIASRSEVHGYVSPNWKIGVGTN